MALSSDLPASAEAEGVAADAALRALFDKARDGDDAALSALCRQMRPRLFRVALSVLHDRDEADDVAQEALVRAVTRRFLFLGTGSVAGWMTKIAFNLAKNRRRDGRRRSEIVAEASQSDLVARGAMAHAAPRPDEAVAETRTRARLLGAMNELPPRQREVMQLRAVAGLDFAAVGTALGISEANARMSFSLAKKKLQALLGGEP
ncbi:MAG: sigma-70 family RNA polymerase sigma factor [Deltaproteobacteria bacterium]|nr:sigma-70 family RNA polymerase sigma factor [Deltaproteobacteria bacterium]